LFCPLASADGERVCGECVWCASEETRDCDNVAEQDLRFKIGDIVETCFKGSCECLDPDCANAANVWNRGVVLRRRMRYKDVHVHNEPLGGCYVYPYVILVLDNGPIEKVAKDYALARIPFDNAWCVRRALGDAEVKTMKNASLEEPRARSPYCRGEKEKVHRVPVPDPLPSVDSFVTRNQIVEANAREDAWKKTCVCGVCRIRRRKKKRDEYFSGCETGTKNESSTSKEKKKQLSFFEMIGVVWDVNQKVWSRLCEHYDVAATNPAREHYYRPNQICCYSQPHHIWENHQLEKDDLVDKTFDREKTVLTCENFAFQFFALSLNPREFEGEAHVRNRSEFPEDWSDTQKDAYAREFTKLVKTFGRDYLGFQFGRDTFSVNDLLVDAINATVEEEVDKMF
jgi:hypothetical protein